MGALGRPVTTAQPGTPCGWNTYGETGTKLTCQGGKDAIHILTKTLPVAQAGTALCAYHSPFEPTQDERDAVGQPLRTKGEAGAARLAAEAAAQTTVSPCGTWALGETVKHAEMGTGVIAYLGSVGGMEIEFSNGSTIGVDEAHYDEWSQVRTDDGPQLDCFQEAMAEAERDDMSGIDMIKELLTLPAVKPTKVKVMHAGDQGPAKTAACGRMAKAEQMTNDPTKVTCKRCPTTRRFQSWQYHLNKQAKVAEFERAGLRTQMLVRHIPTGRFGVIARLDTLIEVYFWTRDSHGRANATFGNVAGFDADCEFVDVTRLVKLGDRLVSALGGESVVLGVTPSSVRYRRMGETAVIDLTATELAAELSRGYMAIVPTTRCRVCNQAVSNTQNHKHFDRPMSWPGMPERPKGTYVRPDGSREQVTTDDMAQVGMRVNYGYGYNDNGLVTKVTWHDITVVRDADGTSYVLPLRDLLRQLNRGDLSTYMPDANGRPIGSWR